MPKRPWRVIVGVKRGGLWDHIVTYTFATEPAARERIAEIQREAAAKPLGPEWATWLQGPTVRYQEVPHA